MIRSVVSVPSLPINVLPCLPGHPRMIGDGVLAVILIHIGVHWHALLPERFVVFRSRQWGENKEFEEIYRQLPLDDLDVSANRFWRVGCKAKDIAPVRNDTRLFPGEQHLAVLGDLVLTFLDSEQVCLIDILKANKNAVYACPPCLLDKVGNLVTKRVDLDHKPDIELFRLAQLD